MAFENRKTWLFDCWTIHGWDLKLYAILGAGAEMNSRIVESVRECVSSRVPFPEEASSRLPQCGFVVVHVGEEDQIWLLVDLWVNDIMRHFLFSAPTNDPDRFDVGPNDGTNACVWELMVISHERDAWVKHVMSPDSPDVEAWRQDVFSIEP